MTLAQRDASNQVLTPHPAGLPGRHRDWSTTDRTRRRQPMLGRFGGWIVAHQVELRWVVPLLALAAAVHGINLHHSPGPNDDEGTYVSQAWSLRQDGQLSHYTYWYDHPPLGWMLLALWNEATLVQLRGEDLLYAGRDAMLAVHLCACALLFVLARRLSLPRWAAALAVAAFTLSPLGLEWQRLTLLDNIGTPFLIAGWVLALSPRGRLGAYAGSAAVIAAACLIKETNALFVPFVAWQLWRASAGPTRRYAVAIFAAPFIGLCALYPLFAVLRGELLEGAGHVSLIGALKWQLLDRGGSGSPFVDGSGSRMAITSWITSDPLIIVLALALAAVVLVRRELRPLAAALTLLLLMPLRGGYLPAPYPINLIWPGALVLAAGAQVIVAGLGRRQIPFLRALAATVAAGTFLLVGARAAERDLPQLVNDEDRNYRSAQTWLFHNTQRDQVFLVDNTIWIRLVDAGYQRQNVVWYYKWDLDPAVQAQHPGGWHEVDYIVSSSIMGATLDQVPLVREAIAHATPVAQFGDITILRVQR